ncbi:hypothetical protein L5515_010661 [Caenorhabditis briggsae]|uniref:F-box domain-containing protein n=1 Tax=Caenorhabditis briggsae TaxID=6238 RepID=A0AAE9JG54_CAEBR|nr:hypothetical protein L5515_010661 [Caenorhabditis briggsae]
MYSAYEKLTIFERRNINRIGIFFKLRKVELDVCGYSRTIIYENSSGNTTVTMGRIDDFQVDDNYLRVFCRDLELILKNQTDCENLESVKTLLPYSSTFSQIEIDYGNTTEDDFETFFNFPCEQYAAKVIFFLEDVKTETIEKMEEQEEKLPEPPYLIVLKTRDLMEQIAQTLEYFDIQNLRRVSSGIRKCMDAVKPDPKIQKYRITVESNHNIKSEIFLRNGQRQFIEYSDENNSRNLDQFTINRRSLIFDDFCDVALNDFYVNLRHQKTVLEELGVKLSYKQAFYSPLSKPDDYYSDDDYSDDEFPPEEKRIPIKHERKELRNPKFDLRVILYLVYDFKELHIEIPIERDCDDEIPDVSKIGNLEIRIETISVEELSHFRTELLKSQTFEVFKIIFENMDSEDSLFANFGEPYHTIRNAKKICYSRFGKT